MEQATKMTIQTAIWGAVGGAVAAIVIGFVWGGWTTSSTTREISDEAVLASQAAICVAQFMKEPTHQEKLDELKKLPSWERREFIKKGGWGKMPGQQEAAYEVNRACADGLELLMEK